MVVLDRRVESSVTSLLTKVPSHIDNTYFIEYALGTSKCAARNESIEEILHGVRVGDRRFDPTVQHHHTFLMGDLNYRLTFDPRVPVSKDRTPSVKDRASSVSKSQMDLEAESRPIM